MLFSFLLRLGRNDLIVGHFSSPKAASFWSAQLCFCSTAFLLSPNSSILGASVCCCSWGYMPSVEQTRRCIISISTEFVFLWALRRSSCCSLVFDIIYIWPQLSHYSLLASTHTQSPVRINLTRKLWGAGFPWSPKHAHDNSLSGAAVFFVTWTLTHSRLHGSEISSEAKDVISHFWHLTQIIDHLLVITEFS